MAEHTPLLHVENLHVEAHGQVILRGIDLTVQAGEVHAIMGPNGSGKSTLAQVLAGRPGYKVTQGSMRFCGVELDGQEPQDRALAGLFLAFQYPVELPGVNNAYFLKAAVNAKRRHAGLEELDAVDFLASLRAQMRALEMNPKLVERSVNDGFSGGEKKRNEILQMALLQPRLAILDETDSGLDIDAMRVVAGGVNRLRRDDRGMLVVTHYQRLLDYIVPDVVHVLARGRIVRSGGPELARELESRGYGWVEGAGATEAPTPASTPPRRPAAAPALSAS